MCGGGAVDNHLPVAEAPARGTRGGHSGGRGAGEAVHREAGILWLQCVRVWRVRVPYNEMMWGIGRIADEGGRHFAPKSTTDVTIAHISSGR